MARRPSRRNRRARLAGGCLLGCALLPSCRVTQSGDFDDPVPRWDPYAYRRDDGWEERGFLLVGERGFQDNLLNEADSQLMIGLELSFDRVRMEEDAARRLFDLDRLAIPVSIILSPDGKIDRIIQGKIPEKVL